MKGQPHWAVTGKRTGHPAQPQQKALQPSAGHEEAHAQTHPHHLLFPFLLALSSLFRTCPNTKPCQVSFFSISKPLTPRKRPKIKWEAIPSGFYLGPPQPTHGLRISLKHFVFLQLQDHPQCLTTPQSCSLGVYQPCFHQDSHTFLCILSLMQGHLATGTGLKGS